ncbi:MAG: HypC/HybG/HupF family hydrogenase formation chaperone [Desulfobacteraceae bacterium]|nr:HypC/HybG/HupF family hydrogenase formation chaperone [Desulfobacteraceae bacterium]
MCLAIPSKVVAIIDDIATIDVDGVRRKASLMLVEDVCVGDYVIVHAGYAISRIDADAAEETLALMHQVFQ